MKTIGVYVHIPFCNTFCSYCDFCKTKPDSFLMEKYIDTLCDEISLFSQSMQHYTVDTIYIGGGTPSILPINLFEKLAICLHKNLKLRLKEFTIEANPDSLDESKIIVYKNFGVSRLSLGVQSMDDNLLKSVGRKHSSSNVLLLIELLQKHSINISVDLLLGIPNSNLNDIKHSLNILSDKVNHISLYALKAEENTPLYRLYQKKPNLMPDDDYVANLYDFSYKYLKQNSFKRYETSNFCKNNNVSKHNLKYWTMSDYIGFGVSSHSKLNNFRFYNISNIDMYIENILLLKNNPIIKSAFINSFVKNANLQFSDKADTKITFSYASTQISNYISKIENETISKEDIIFEDLMLALRLSKGINIEKFNRKYSISFTEKFKVALDKNSKYMKLLNNRIFIKEDFFYLLNSILLDFMN